MSKEDFKKIETFKDIEFEKERLSLQIQLSEEKIHNDFSSLANKLTFAAISSQIKESTFGTIYKAFTLAYRFFNRYRKTNEE